MKKPFRLLILSLALGMASGILPQKFISCVDNNNIDDLTAESLPESELHVAPASVVSPYTYTNSPTNEPWYSESHNFKNTAKESDGAYYQRNQKTTTFDFMNVTDTWKSYRGENVKVAVIDTGCYTSHEDFNGTDIKSISKNMVSGTTGTLAVNDTDGHGTSSAATISAAINGKGGTGIAPNVELIILKCVDANNAFSNAAINNALQYCIDNDVDVINMSIQGYNVSSNFQSTWFEDFGKYTVTDTSKGIMTPNQFSTKLKACHDAGITLVAAAGNYNTNQPSYPAANDYVIAVGSTGLESATAKAGYSNYGDWLDISAPGYVYTPSLTGTDKYSVTNGTSFSAPLVTGAIALYKSKYPDATPDQIEAALKSSAQPISWQGGAGALDVDEFLATSPETALVESVTLSEHEKTLTVGETYQLSATVLPSGANQELTYESSDSSICSVSNIGLVRGVAKGTATIKAISAENTNKYDTVSITVNPSQEASIYKTVTFTSSTMSVGTNSYTTGSFTNTSDGVTTTVSCGNNNNKDWSSVKFGSSKQATTGTLQNTSLIDKAVTKIDLTFQSCSSVTSATLYVSNNASFTNATEINFSPSGTKCSIDISSPIQNGYYKIVFNIAKASSNGPVNLKKIEYWAVDGGGTTETTKTLSKIEVSELHRSFAYGAVFVKETVTATYSDGTTADVTNDATFSGYTANQSGQQTITVTYGEQTITYTVTVSEPVVTNYTVTFNSNGGSGTMTSDTTNGSSYVTLTCTFTKEGYTFDKWALDSATGTKYSVGDTISDISKDITLYATWKANSSGDGEDDGEYQYYNGNYYDQITNDQISEGGTSLITALKNLIQPKTAFGYGNIWTFNENYDKYPSDYDGTDPLTGNVYPTTNNTQKRGKMWDMYSDQIWNSSQQGKNYSTIGDGYNREHSMPKSWFGGSDKNQPGTDPNHLFNTDGKVNGMRSNYPYGEVVKDITFDGYTLAGKKATGFGKLGKNSSNTIVFEPDDAYKGDFARAQMYMATAYYNWNLTQDTSGAYCFTYSNGVSTMKSYYIDLLTKWSAEDPVSQKEIDRNNAVYNSTQKNRNPFIDHPTWANKIWGGTPYTWNGKSSGDETVNVTGVSINKTKASITVGGSLTLIPTVTPNNASNKTVNWSSSNEKVATVSNGVVTGVSTGETTIKVITVDGSFEATCVVTVTENESVESITITRDSCSGTGGYSWYNWSSGDISGQLYYYASEKSKIQMNSSKTGKALFSSTSSGSKIKSITIKSASETPNFTVYGSNSAYSTTNVSSGTSIGSKNSSTSGVKWDFGSNDFEYFSIVLGGSAAGYISEVIIEYKASSSTTPSITSVTVSPKSLSLDLYNKETGDLSVNVMVTNGAAQTVYWSSSDSTVATVDPNGKVTALKVGSATITATSTVDSTKNDTCTVTVDDSTPAAVTGVTLDKTTASISLGNTITLVPTVTPTNAANKNVAWSSSDESVATVSDGVVTSKGVGTATITVTTVDGGFTASCTVTVTAAPVITYQLEADQETVPYMSGTNHQVSVGVKLYQYSNGVKGSQVASSTGSVDTSVLGPAKISYTYQSVTYETSVKVTNNGADIGINGENHEETVYTDASALISFSKGDAVSSTTGSITAIKQGETKENVQFTVKRTGEYEGYNGGDNFYHKIGTKNNPKHNLTLTTTSPVYNVTSIEFMAGYYTEATDIKVTIGNEIVYNGSTAKASGIAKITANLAKAYSGILKIEFYSEKGRTLLQSVKMFYQEESTTIIDGEIHDATPAQQAKAWSNYFIKLTGGGEFDGPCKLGTPEAKKAALQQVWGELKSEYVYMVEGSKTAFCSTDATETIAEAVQHYRYIVNTYGLEDFAKVPQVSSSNRLIPISDSEPFIIGVIAMVGLAAIGGYFVYKRRREE